MIADLLQSLQTVQYHQRITEYSILGALCCLQYPQYQYLLQYYYFYFSGKVVNENRKQGWAKAIALLDPNWAIKIIGIIILKNDS